MTDDNYEDYEPIEDNATANDVKAMLLSGKDLKLHYDEGELNHLSTAELETLFSNASTRDLQATIIR